MSDFTHLHVHSHFSLLDGLAKIDDLIAKAKEYKMSALALTDHGVMYGAIEFYKKAKASGLKPIIGLEAYISPGKMTDKTTLGEGDKKYYHLLLLAENEQGYKNLIKITTLAHLKGFYYKPRIDLEHLKKYSDGLIASSACLAGEIPRKLSNNQIKSAYESIKKYQAVFGKDKFFLELQHHPHIIEQAKVNSQLQEIAKKTQTPIVATADSHYVSPGDNEAQEILLCLQNKVTLDTPNRSLSMINEDFSFPSPEQMEKEFSYLPQALENTAKIAKNCQLEIELGKIKLPRFPIPTNYKTDQEYLAELARQGLNKRYTWTSLTDEEKKIIQDRLDFELSVIEKTGFASYFLIVQDFVNWAKARGIAVGPGRGSAAGSLVSYLLNITDLDPIKYELFFERFLNPERVSMPDIDLDFADHRRDEVIDYVKRKYGEDHVAQIITFGTMAARAAVRDTGRVLNLGYAFCDQVAKLIPMFTSLSGALEKEPELKSKYDSDPQVKKLIDTAKKLEGVARHASTHACGIVITSKPLAEVTATQYASASDRRVVTQYEMHAIEDLGLLKMDFLGLKNLTIIEKTLNIIEKIYAQKIDIAKLPLADKKTFDLLAKAQTTGVFQLESGGMKRYLKELKPTEIEDIIAMVSLYRPGPMEYIPDYIAGKHGLKTITYLHPKLEPILNKTYGVAIYQEQILQIARDIAGFSLGEADVLRRAIGKKIKELLDEQKEKFIAGCLKQGNSKSLGEKLFSFIEPFARYGFNRSHAACYALIGYQTAYLKANYPACFMAALLSCDQENLDRVAIEVAECRALGIEVLPPDVNESFTEFTVITNAKQPTIRFGLGAIKNLGYDVVGAIIQARKGQGKFKDLSDFLSRVKNKNLNKKSLEALAKSGALDSLTVEKNVVLTNLDRILDFVRLQHKDNLAGQNNLFASSSVELRPVSLKLDSSLASSAKQNLKWEKEFLGLYVSDHPLKEFAVWLNQNATLCHNLNSQLSSQIVRVGGVITNLKRIFTKNGEPMIFAKIEDFSGQTELLVFPKILEKTKELWLSDKLVLAQGQVSDKDGEIKILVNEVWPLGQDLKLPHLESTSASGRSSWSGNRNYANRPSPISQTAARINQAVPQAFNKFVVKIKSISHNDILTKLKQILLDYPGFTKVYLLIPGAQKTNKIETSFRVSVAPELLERLRTLEEIEIVN